MPIIFLFLACLLFPVDAFANEAGYWSEMIFYIRTQQQLFHREMAGAIRAIQDGGLHAIWAMITISFLYGVFHAAGPGHGKAVIGTYLLSHESKLKKGIALSFASAFIQGLSAIVLVEGLVGIIGLSRSDAKDAVPMLEMVSFALIALIGLVLVKRGVQALWQRNHHKHKHDHHHSDHVCSTCGHSHAPDPALLTPKSSLKDVLAIIFSVGIRPCSGSVLMLIFAELIGLRFAGIAAVMAISLGTAITVSSLALLAIYFRKTALYIAERQSGSFMQNLSLIGAISGGAFIFAIGLSLLWQASQTSHPLF
ncbi:nickel/cobalt efflux system [Terasakiella brassicae]|uniref:Nickel/cobalt efflux system n=1 Tax=Terasakiella brassicae TaxID=1634917 RepID=A0A917F9S0_9PROT|nr:nickel/cobalt transporter [Terasakiella brassicae]GGF63201.1 nickel/cobalt efflux system [Terasakiella brassicae]